MQDLAPAWIAILSPGVAIGVALLADRWLGEPPLRWHPVAAMGQALAWLGRWAAPPAHVGAEQRWGPWGRGALGWMVGAVVVAGGAALLAGLVAFVPLWLQAVLLGLLLKPLLAWRMLHQEVQQVETALAVSLQAGQAQLSRLVSREVSSLDEAAVRQAALSSLSENLNDSVVAPLFWFAVAGLPGAALYRWANTADAMWGYRGERNGRIWTWAGHWAARADDVLSWLPARLTGVLLLGWGSVRRVRALPQQARRTPSPNGGWPMGALALALNVRLCKP
ncbi:MAG: adenosylcobinamide-phosphate synthase CbiB, partial [Serpentinimonas sp.]|nr:adenosylcobinamide-phosphate synthase CbiB [Serpentinimonas sp.]